MMYGGTEIKRKIIYYNNNNGYDAEVDLNIFYLMIID
jgi:hypothetical protein